MYQASNYMSKREPKMLCNINKVNSSQGWCFIEEFLKGCFSRKRVELFLDLKIFGEDKVLHLGGLVKETPDGL
jgi:hypothetical protein